MSRRPAEDRAAPAHDFPDFQTIHFSRLRPITARLIARTVGPGCLASNAGLQSDMRLDCAKTCPSDVHGVFAFARVSRDRRPTVRQNRIAAASHDPGQVATTKAAQLQRGINQAQKRWPIFTGHRSRSIAFDPICLPRQAPGPGHHSTSLQGHCSGSLYPTLTACPAGSRLHPIPDNRSYRSWRRRM